MSGAAEVERRVLRRANVTPHKSLLPKLGYSGYSFPESIAELVDNSIEWRVEGEVLEVRITVSEDEVVVEDNACGMNDERLENAFRLAYRDERSREHTELSQYGVGMKTACASLGHAFEVRSTVPGTSSVYEVRWDEESWGEGDGFDWDLPVYEVADAVEEAVHGTTVRVTELKYKPVSRVTELKRDLGQRYAHFLDGGEVRIKVNTRWVEPYRPPVEESTVEEFAVEHGDDLVHGWFGLLEEGSQRGYYGWETKRRGRMITSHDKRFGLREHPRFSKVVGEVHLDHLDVSHNKTRWIEDDVFQEVQELLRGELTPRLEALVASQEDLKARREVRRVVKRWLEAVDEALEDEYFQQFEAPEMLQGTVDRDRGRQRERERQRESVERLAREHPTPVSEEERVPLDGEDEELDGEDVEARQVLRVGGARLRVEHLLHPMGTHGPWFDWGVSDAGVLEVFTNHEFPAFEVTGDQAFYSTLHIAEAIAQLFARETAGDVDVDEVRQNILREATEHLADVVA